MPKKSSSIALYVLLSVAVCLVPVGRALGASNFIQTYIDSRQACRSGASYPIMGLTQEEATPSPFGREAGDWSDDDLNTLKQALVRCVISADALTRRNVRVEADELFKSVSERVAQARLTKEAEHRASVARKEVAEEKLRQAQQREEETRSRDEEQQRRILDEQRAAAEARTEADASLELQAFLGHIMSPAEVDRAQQIKQQLPSLAARVDGLLAAQNQLKQQAEEQGKQAQEREETARRIEAERQKRVLAQQRAQEEAKVEADKKEEAFANALPQSCKLAQMLEAELYSNAMQDRVTRADTLAEAGDQQGACGTFIEVASKSESLRAKLVQCTKDLDSNDDSLARKTASEALNKAIEIHTRQKGLTLQIKEMHCG